MFPLGGPPSLAMSPLFEAKKERRSGIDVSARPLLIVPAGDGHRGEDDRRAEVWFGAHQQSVRSLGDDDPSRHLAERRPAEFSTADLVRPSALWSQGHDRHITGDDTNGQPLRTEVHGQSVRNVAR